MSADYEAIDLPVFTCSARDYVRIKGASSCTFFYVRSFTLGHIGQVKGDGDPTCFTKVDDTGIPALQEWCHKLTISSRSRAARNFLSHLTTFAKNVHVFLHGVGDVTEEDRLAMKEQWESDMAQEPDVHPDYASSDSGYMDVDDDVDDPFAGLHTIKQTKLGPDGKPAGVTPRLLEASPTLACSLVPYPQCHGITL